MIEGEDVVVTNIREVLVVEAQLNVGLITASEAIRTRTHHSLLILINSRDGLWVDGVLRVNLAFEHLGKLACSSVDVGEPVAFDEDLSASRHRTTLWRHVGKLWHLEVGKFETCIYPVCAI